MNNRHPTTKPLATGRQPLAAHFTILALLFLPMVLAAAGEPTEILLWPNGAPGSEGKTGVEIVNIAANGDRRISNVHKPSITLFLPSADTATGAAVIIAPGGAHTHLSMDMEGCNEAKWLSEHGIAAFVLKYRLAKETNSTYTVERDEVADIQRAIRLVRSRATEWGVDPGRLGVMGFSAGGELAYLASMRFDSGAPDALDAVDRQNSRPDFQALIYPGNLQNFVPTTNSPPAFLACGNKDRPEISEGLAQAYLKLKLVKVPAEMHIYAGVGHAFGFRPGQTTPVSTWIESFYAWLGQSGFLKKP
jgi:acetyl esterase/lipase